MGVASPSPHSEKGLRMCVSLCVASYSFSSSIRREGYVVASIALSSIVVALINFKEVNQFVFFCVFTFNRQVFHFFQI